MASTAEAGAGDEERPRAARGVLDSADLGRVRLGEVARRASAAEGGAGAESAESALAASEPSCQVKRVP